MVVVPSPKSHEKVYGDVPPDAVPLNVVACPVLGLVGLSEKLLVTGMVTAGRHAATGCSSHPVYE